MAAQYLPVTWKAYHTLAQKLASAVLTGPSPVDIIVAIARGGLTLGHLLSDHLRIPIATIAIQSYTDIQSQGEVVMTEKLRTPIRGTHVLLVDDVSDSGKTFRRGVRYLRRLGPKEISTLAMFFKPRSSFRPDYYARQTKKWILFPYEPTEMILLLTQKKALEGKTKADIQKFLQSLGYTANQIAFVRKHHVQ